MKYLTTKNLVIAMVLFFAVLIAVITYRIFFQFNDKDVAIYIDEAASGYEDKERAFKLIHDGVEHILCSHNKTQQVLTMVEINKTPKEQELVHSAVLDCVSHGYLKL